MTAWVALKHNMYSSRLWGAFISCIDNVNHTNTHTRTHHAMPCHARLIDQILARDACMRCHTLSYWSTVRSFPVFLFLSWDHRSVIMHPMGQTGINDLQDYSGVISTSVRRLTSQSTHRHCNEVITIIAIVIKTVTVWYIVATIQLRITVVKESLPLCLALRMII